MPRLDSGFNAPGARCARPVRTGTRAMAGLAAFSVVGVVAAASIVSACSDEPERTVASYCEEVAAKLPALVGPVIGTGADVVALLATYRSIAAVAPATVAPEWETVVSTLETVSTVVPSDPASLEAANVAALAGQPSYTRIQQYTQVECNVTIGTPPAPTNPVTATTIPASTSTPGSGADG